MAQNLVVQIEAVGRELEELRRQAEALAARIKARAAADDFDEGEMSGLHGERDEVAHRIEDKRVRLEALEERQARAEHVGAQRERLEAVRARRERLEGWIAGRAEHARRAHELMGELADEIAAMRGCEQEIQADAPKQTRDIQRMWDPTWLQRSALSSDPPLLPHLIAQHGWGNQRQTLIEDEAFILGPCGVGDLLDELKSQQAALEADLALNEARAA